MTYDLRLTTNLRLIFLIGMPGAGKSYWAEHIAEAYDYELLDIDDEIEEDEDMEISDIFDKRGEDWFRAKEKEILQELINSKPEDSNSKVIVACGGGTPCFFDNIKLMKDAGTVIYLKAKAETIIERIMNELDKRPLLAEQTELVEYAQELLETHKSIYEQAHHILDVENITITNFKDII